MIIRHRGIVTGHPQVTVANRDGRPVVSHGRRGSEQALLRNRLQLVAIGLLGLSVIAFLVVRPGLLERLNTVGVGAGVLALVVLALVTGYWFAFGRGYEEIQLWFGLLQVRMLPLDLGRGVTVDRAEIDRLQVEKDGNGRRARYRVQIVGLDGQGKLPSYGAMCGIPTRDEATALALAIAQQFDLPLASGVQPQAARRSRFEEWLRQQNEQDGLEADPYLPVQQPVGTTKGVIRSDAGPTVTYHDNRYKRLGGLAFSLFWLALVVGMTLAQLREAPLRPVELLWPVPFWIVGIGGFVHSLSHTEIHLEKDRLVRRLRLSSIALRQTAIPLANVERVATAVAWDSYNNMYYRVVAKAKRGEDFVLVNELPEDDGHALVQALHKQLGLPI